MENPEKSCKFSKGGKGFKLFEDDVEKRR